VVVTASRQVAFRATLLAFIVPLVILMVVLVVAIRATGSEAVAALSALGALMLWYSLLWLLRSTISSQVSFQIEEIKEKQLIK
jgi:sigma-E factor negative regulatory protein RseC